ncbi:MAG: sulfatase-like hydrolase/transferase, partial [Planctomycetaceae bacterium]|nr:sulfatase-like hydrolase/transferase [Planctomycetaceae bacterium]
MATEPDRPNILWITSEDNGPELGCYGDAVASTPHLDRLAAAGMRYQHCWSNAPVCAPARTTIVSGMYPTTTGSQHMRSNVECSAEVEFFPRLLRRAGYYCCNRSKEDYNLRQSPGLWDDSSPRAHWRHREPNQPFFAVVNFTTTHESQIRSRPHQPGLDPQQVSLPPFHPDLPAIRQDWAQYYDKIAAMDQQVGDLLAELERDGLRDDTIIFYFGDHGTGMPRGKRWLYETG